MKKRDFRHRVCCITSLTSRSCSPVHHTCHHKLYALQDTITNGRLRLKIKSTHLVWLGIHFSEVSWIPISHESHKFITYLYLKNLEIPPPPNPTILFWGRCVHDLFWSHQQKKGIVLLDAQISDFGCAPKASQMARGPQFSTLNHRKSKGFLPHGARWARKKFKRMKQQNNMAPRVFRYLDPKNPTQKTFSAIWKKIKHGPVE